MINHKGQVIDWQVFENRCRLAGAENHTYKYLSLVSEFMGARLPEAAVVLITGKTTQGDLRKMRNVLQGRGEINYLPGVFRTLHSFDRKADRWHYLADLFFPPRTFMMKRYRLRYAIQLVWFYPYRSLKAFYGIFQMLVNKIRYGIITD
jgi:hypothetical protein